MEDYLWMRVWLNLFAAFDFREKSFSGRGWLLAMRYGTILAKLAFR